MKRIKHFDLLRVICFLLIIYYHMVAQLPVNGICSYGDIWPFVANENLQIGTFAVSVFFMLSGASLMHTTKEKIAVGKFYLKRYVRLLIPFYVVTFLYYIVNAIRVRDLAGVYVGGIPVWRWIFTILGMDEWVSMHGIVTFSRGIGEWFLGVLVILSLIFPLLRYLMLKNTKVFMVVATILYLLVIYNYNSDVLIYMSLPVKAYDFILGMWFALYWEQIHKIWKYLAVAVVAVFLFWPTAIEMNEALKILILGFSIVMAFSLLEGVLQKCNMRGVNWLSKYSYELYLVHHLVIYAMTPYQPPVQWGIKEILWLFAKEAVVIFVIALVAKTISDRIIGLVLKKGKAK